MHNAYVLLKLTIWQIHKHTVEECTVKSTMQYTECTYIHTVYSQEKMSTNDIISQSTTIKHSK